MMIELKQVIVVRRDLNMTRGKESAQVAHAVLSSILPRRDDTVVQEWLENSQSKVVVSVDDHNELCRVMKEAEDARLWVAAITDAGRTMFHGNHTLTCAAIGPDISSKIDQVTGSLKLR